MLSGSSDMVREQYIGGERSSSKPSTRDVFRLKLALSLNRSIIVVRELCEASKKVLFRVLTTAIFKLRFAPVSEVLQIQTPLEYNIEYNII